MTNDNTMPKKKDLVLNPAYKDIESSIRIYFDDDNNEYWSLNDLNSFVPEKRLDNFLANQDAKDFIQIVEKFIIPEKSGIIGKRGKGGGTYAHRLIALRFAAWLSKEFEVQIYLEYDKKRKDYDGWNKERGLSKYEYRLMTDAIKNHLVIDEKDRYSYAKEAMLLNSIVFGKDKFDYNPRESATIEELAAISVLERYNATFIEMEMNETERRERLMEMHRKKNMKLLEE